MPRPDGDRARCGGPTLCAKCRSELEAAHRAEAAELAATYRERAALLALLAVLFPAVLARSDPALPGWAVLTVETPAGQMCWHVADDDLDLLPHVRWGTPEPWDGHDTPTKYRRLSSLVQMVAGGTVPLQPAAPP